MDKGTGNTNVEEVIVNFGASCRHASNGESNFWSLIAKGKIDNGFCILACNEVYGDCGRATPNLCNGGN